MEIAKIALENEMDLILAHKQSMKLAELAGLSITAQTSFATAVSEISRVAIDQSSDSCLRLFTTGKASKKHLIAQIHNNCNTLDFSPKTQGYGYARRLVEKIDIKTEDKNTSIDLYYLLPSTTHIGPEVVDRWRVSLNTDPTISPYEEIKRKNNLLFEIAEKLRESEAQYKILTNTLPLLIFSISSENEILYANKWFTDYLRISVNAITADSWKAVIHPEDYDGMMQLWAAGIEKEEMVRMEYRLKNAAIGEYRWHLGITTPLKDESGKLLYWVGYLVDIHARKTIEETLKANKELTETKIRLEEKIAELNNTNQRLEQFAYIASHDLQEPLRKISFYSDYLLLKYNEPLGSDGANYMGKLMKAADRMKILIKDVLAYSVIKKETDHFEQVNLNHIVREAIQDLETAIDEKKAALTVDDLPDIEGNSRQLKQIFENLLSNSIKYSRQDVPPQIHISAKVQKDIVHISVTDNGIGFNEEYMDKMFDLFQRLHSQDKYKGTGIGLAICKKIAETHSGHITASSKGNGATFTVSLPVTQPAEY